MPDSFNRDPNFVPDTRTTRGLSVSYEDTSFVTGDSPVVLDVNNDLGVNGCDGFLVVDGEGSITVEISNDGTNWGGSHTIKKDETLHLEGLNINKIRLTHTGTDSSYRVFCV